MDLYLKGLLFLYKFLDLILIGKQCILPSHQGAYIGQPCPQGLVNQLQDRLLLCSVLKPSPEYYCGELHGLVIRIDRSPRILRHYMH